MTDFRLPQGIVAFDIGLGLIRERQGLLRCADGWRRVGFAVNETVQQVEDMRLGWNTGLQRRLDGREHGLFVVLKNESQDVDHFAITAGLLEQMLLQGLERVWWLVKGSSVPQSARFAFDHGQAMPPVVDRLTGSIMGPVDDPAMLAHDLALRSYDDAIWIDPQADWSIGKGGCNAVAVAFQVDEAGRSDTLRVLDKAVEEPGNTH